MSAQIYCKRITKQLRLDLEKHNEQYPAVEIIPFDAAHDRFLILDESSVAGAVDPPIFGKFQPLEKTWAGCPCHVARASRL